MLHERKEQRIGRLVNEAVNIGSDVAIDKGESSIISNILSMEFDAWDDSLISSNSLAKLLGDNTDNQNGPLKKSSSWKVQSNQSRFSFARQEESKIQVLDVHPSHGANQQFPRSRSLIQDFVERDLSLDKLVIANGFPANNLEESESLGSGHFVASSNKLSAVSRAQISAPPGFSVPSRSPPPGNSLLDPSFLLRNSYQTSSNGNIGGAGDIEFMDPAILAVGKGRLHDQSQVSNLASFPQLSLQQSRNAILSNGQWDGWNEVQSGNSMEVRSVEEQSWIGT
ncbi:hypothetical protein SESBI_33632 [Sesbania bispinosa]|nr:hypothetical protein SESBI_33632 [Sesbania bispinosa]